MARFYSVIVMLCVAVTMFAQEVSEKKSGDYYLQLTGGINYGVTENVRFFNIRELLYPSFNFSVGKEFTPYINGEIQLGMNRNTRIYSTILGIRNNFTSWELFATGHYNLSTDLFGNKPNRKNNLYASAGLGIAYSIIDEFDKDVSCNKLTPGLHLGLTYAYSFSEKVAGIADFGYYIFTDNYNALDVDFPFDQRFHVQVGLRFYLGK